MNTNINTREQISALADGELNDASTDEALFALRDSQSQADWEIYHRIGDALRSEELAAPLSADFSARMAARLQAEMPHVPVIAPNEPQSNEHNSSQAAGGMLAAARRYLWPSVAGTATVVLAFLMAPQWMSGVPDTSENTLVMPAPTHERDQTAIVPASAMKHEGATVQVAEAPTLASEDDIVRDPLIDQYLMAHQRFSPAAYSSSQFTRAATFAPEANK